MTALRKLCVVMVVLLAGCATRQSSDAASRLVAKIKNVDIRWDGNYLGLQPTASGPAKELLREPSEKVVPALMDALKDEERFVVAHVLLSEITGFKKQIDAASWNGLRVELLPNGRVIVPSGQQSTLIQQWAGWSARH